MKKILFVLSLYLGLASAFGADFGSHVVECSALLKAAQISVSDSGDSTKSTLDAFQNLHLFKSHLQSTLKSPTSGGDAVERVFATSNDAPAPQVLTRLEGIARQWNDRDEATGRKVMSYGALRVSDDALLDISNQDAVRDNFENAYKIYFKRKKRAIVRGYARDLLGLGAGVFIYHVLPQLKPMVEIASAMVVVGAAAETLPFVIRSRLNFDKQAPKKRQAVQIILDQSTAGAWAYRGETYYVNKKLLDWIDHKDFNRDAYELAHYVDSLEKDPSSLMDESKYTPLDKFGDDLTILQQGLVRPGNFSNPPDGEEYRAVYIDQLLQMRASEGGAIEPQLTLFVRIANEKTKLKVEATEQEKSRLGLRSILPARVR